MADDEADATPDGNDEHDSPTLRQRLHAATGDRDAEAKALADRAGEDIDTETAKRAVQRAHGDAGVDQPMPDSELASPADAESVKRDEAPEAG